MQVLHHADIMYNMGLLGLEQVQQARDWQQHVELLAQQGLTMGLKCQEASKLHICTVNVEVTCCGLEGIDRLDQV